MMSRKKVLGALISIFLKLLVKGGHNLSKSGPFENKVLETHVNWLILLTNMESVNEYTQQLQGKHDICLFNLGKL